MTVLSDQSQSDDLSSWLTGIAPEAAEDLVRLRRLLDLLDQYQAERWDRHVSTADSIVDRWERARRMGFGEGTSVYDSALVLGDVTVGANTWIGPATVLDGSGGLVIGDHCSISAGVQIYSHDSLRRTHSAGQADVEHKHTRVGSRTYIGPNAVISKGVEIGEGCIVGAFSLVLSDFPPESFVYGIPAKTHGDVTTHLGSRGPD